MREPGDELRTATLRRRFESIEATALVGLAFAAVAFAASTLLALPPQGGATQAELAGWYEDPGNRQLLITGLALAVIAGVTFLWFIAVIRRRVGEREDQFFATVFLGSGILLTAILLVGATVRSSIAIGLELENGVVPDLGTFTLFDGLASGLLLLVLPRIEAVFIITTSTVGLRTGAFPFWLALVGYVIGVGMFVLPLLIDPILAIFPVWVGLMSAVLLVRTRQAVRVDTEGPQPSGGSD